MRIGYLTGMIPGRMHNGTEIATRTIADALRSRGHDVSFFGHHRLGDPTPPGIPADQIDVRPIEFDGANRRHRLLWSLTALLRHEPLSVSKYRGAGVETAFARLFSRFDLVLVDKAQLAWIHRDALAAVPHSVVWHAIEHRTYGQVADSRRGLQATVYHREARLLETIERRLLAPLPHAFALTEADAATLRDLGCRGRIDVLPLTVPLSLVAPPADFACDVGLLGAWTWSANATGLDWFLDRVWPSIAGDLAVAVGGHGSLTHRPEIVGPRRVGFVDDAKAFLGAARVVAIPLVGGTGISMKLVEAAAQGWPTVTTSVGVRGIDRLPPNVVVTDDPAAFAAALRDLRDVPEETRSAWRDAGRLWYDDRISTLAERLDQGVAAARALNS